MEGPPPGSNCAPAPADTNRSAPAQASRQRLRMVITQFMTYFSATWEETSPASRFLHRTRSRLLQAFERELLTLLPRLRRFARALAHDSADADDLLQVALERALKARNQWAPGTRLDAWMMRIVRNCWIDEMRSRARRARTFAPEEEGEMVGVDLQHEIDAKAEMRAVDRAMASLSPEQREVIALVLVEGLAYREAAELLEIPMGTLTSRLTRGRQALAQMLEAA
jgi:RNA polymerase sigma-70 factor (ECF subfamily)